MSTEITKKLNYAIEDVRERKNLLTTIAATSIAYALPPCQESDAKGKNLYSFFDKTLTDKAKVAVIACNEEIIVSVQECLLLVRTLWVLRMRIIFDPLAVAPLVLAQAVALADSRSNLETINSAMACKDKLPETLKNDIFKFNLAITEKALMKLNSSGE